MKNKILKILTKIWAIVSLFLLFTGGLTVIGYIAALIIGAQEGAALIDFLYNKVFSVLIYTNSILIIVGLIKMELAGEKALTISSNKGKNKETEQTNISG